MLRQIRQAEDRLVCEIAGLGEARYRWHRGARSCRDDEAARADPRATGLDEVGASEARRGLDHMDAEPLEPRDAVMRGDGGDDAMHMRVDLAEADLRRRRMNPEALGVAHGLCGVGRGDQGLGRNAAGVETVAAHLALLDQDDGRAHLHRPGGYRQTARPRADDAEIGAQHTVDACGALWRQVRRVGHGDRSLDA